MFYNKIVDGLINKWGYEKFIRVIASGIIGAGVSVLIAESIIPNEPVIKNKEEEN